MSLMSLKHDTDHPPIFMASLSTELVDHLKSWASLLTTN